MPGGKNCANCLRDTVVPPLLGSQCILAVDAAIRIIHIEISVELVDLLRPAKRKTTTFKNLLNH